MSRSNSAHVAADVASKFDARITTFLVGPQKVRFHIHYNVLRQAQAGDFLAKTSCDGFRETKELPNDGSAEFQFFVNSLYGVWTESTESPFKCEGLKVSQKLELYAFAHKYACHDFQNAIISSLYHFEPRHDWVDAICRYDLERFVADVPDGSPMHEFLTDWLIKDRFNMQPGVNTIEDEFLEGLPEFLVRAALKHTLTYNFPRSITKKMPLKMKAKGRYLVPEDNQVREQVNAQCLVVGDADNAVRCQGPPASAPSTSQPTYVCSADLDYFDGEAGEETFTRPRKRRRFQRGSSV